MTRALRRAAAAALRPIRAADHAIHRLGGRRAVLIEARTPMNLAVLRPVVDPLLADSRIALHVTGPERGDLDAAFAEAGLTRHKVRRDTVRWRRFDLYINADPWEAVSLRRAARRMNFFHGVAGKYDLDCPTGLPLGLDRYDAVAFPNEGRLANYVNAGILSRSRAVLVGYPKADALLNQAASPSEMSAALNLDPSRPTVIYAPTFSPASSLDLAGEAIVRALLATGANVIVKLHDRSLDTDARYTGGVDWRATFAQWALPDRFLFAASGDSTPYVQASHLMVTDHSSIGFEFCAMDRPLVVYDAPGLAAAARINPDKLALLRSAAVVVANPEELQQAVRSELAAPARLSGERRRAASEVFYRPGSATARALRTIYGLLDLPPASASIEVRAAGAWSGIE